MKKHHFIAASLLGTAIISGCSSHQSHSTPTTPTIDNTSQVALVLGGGGTRGYAHIGAIKALEEHGIRPDMVVGTSAGAMVGAVYASGKSAQNLENIAKNLDESNLIDIKPSKYGMIEGKALRDFINKQVNHKPIEKLPMRFAAVATEVQSKTAVVFEQGDTGLAVQASSSVANLFTPVSIPTKNGKQYIDGSQTALLPATIAKSMGAKVVIAVDVMASPIEQTGKTATAGISRSDKGIKAVWGDEVIEFAIDSDAIAKSTQDLPISINLDKLFNMLPKDLQIPLPKGMPTNLPKTKDDVMRMMNVLFLQNSRQASPADVRASDVLIAPDLSAHAVFDGSKKDKIIQAGYEATLAKMPQIKQAIASQSSK